ncbi:MAG TPA: SBBP repeat-containing protein [Pyrinomonadaceae bacterium]|nr:SBBP repeat-containing protein [Pyrinomonadaceae bacterium]
MPRPRTVISLSCLLAAILTIGLFTLPGGSRAESSAPPQPEAADQATAARAGAAYGKLPLSFVADEVGGRARFVSRGKGYSLTLTPTEAVLVLAASRGSASPAAAKNDSHSAQSQVLVMKMVGANSEPRLTGLDELPGKVNYLLGNDAAKWRTNVPTYAKVKYADVYRGVDLVYYGNGRQLEYDFVVAPGADPGAIEMEFQGARSISISPNGDLVLRADGGEMTLKKPVAYQELDGRTVGVAGRYVIKGARRVGFRLGQYDKASPLVIDPVLVYSTYLGGGLAEEGHGIAVDSSGNAFVTGRTVSPNFPAAAGSLQTAHGGEADAFVTKLDPTGSAVLYSTYLGGGGTDTGRAIAVNAAGHAFVTGDTFSDDFPTANALHPSRGGSSDAFVAELNDTGTALVYSTYLGGRSLDSGFGIAVDSSGNAYVTGVSDSRDFPVANALQPNKLGTALFKTTDATGSWNPSDTGLTAATVFDLAFAPNNPSVIYAAADTGIFKSTDGGANWATTGAAPPPPFIRLAVSPANASVVYLTTNNGVYKSTDGGASWSPSGLAGFQTRAIAINPSSPSILYASAIPGSSAVFKSTDGGATWNTLPPLSNSSIVFIGTIIIDPATPSTVYAGTQRGLYKSTNSGASWSLLNFGSFTQPAINAAVIDPNNSQTLYAAASTGIFRTTNGGANWTKINPSTPMPQMLFLALDSANPLTIYVANRTGAIFKTTDGGANWAFLTNTPTSSINALLIDPTDASKIYLGGASGTDAFAAKLAAGGGSLVYSTYLGGSRADNAAGIAIDAAGNAYVVGGTASANFPVANALQPAKGDAFADSDGFVTKINPAGSALLYSTYLGGEFTDEARAVAVDQSGNAYVTGSTNSINFPVQGGLQNVPGPVSIDAFVTKINASGSALVYSTYLGSGGEERGYGIAVNSSGSAYVTGVVRGSNFPTVNAIQPSPGSVMDAFVTQLNPAGSALVYSTYLGGGNNDEGRAVAVDSAGGVYVTGMTSSGDFPVANPLQPNQAGLGDAFVAKILPAVDLAVTMTDSPDPVQLGNNVTYKIAVRNVGDLPATNVTLQDTLPSGAALVSVATTRGTCGGTGPVNCNLGNLAVGTAAVVTIVVKPSAAQTVTNTAVAACAESEATLANNTASQETSVTSADLALRGATAYNRVAPGARVNYIFTITNNGLSPSNKVKLTDDLPAGLTFASCAAQDGACGGTGNNRIVTFTSLAPGKSATVLLSATVNAGVAEGTVLTNTATVAAATSDPDPSNNSAGVAVTVTDTPLRKKINGIKIAFSSGRVYTVRPNGSEPPVQFPNIPDDSRFPTWSPDGKRLAFMVFKFDPNTGDSQTRLQVVKADGTDIQTLADNVVDISTDRRSKFSWSPDGTRIVYVGDDRFTYLANTDGTGYARLPKITTDVKDIDWSPDGTRLLYSKFGVIYVVNLDGSGLTKLRDIGNGPDGQTSNSEPAWSPDMTQILFTQSSNNYSDVFVMNSDGTAARRLLNVRQTSAPAWSPDGTKLAFYQLTEVHAISVSGLGNVKLAENEPCCGLGTASWQPVPTNVPLVPPTTPPAQTFSISGKLTNANGGTFLGRTTVVLSGTRGGQLNPEIDGTYEFTNLPAGGNYTVKPAGGEFSFTPAQRVFNNLGGNQTGADFVGTYIPINITGHVRDTAGNPIAGVRVTSNGGFPVGSTLTDANGFYSFPNVQRHRSYTLSIQWYGPYAFEPQFKHLPDLNSDAVVDFVGTRLPTNTIGGRITSKEAPNTGVSGVRVSLGMDNGHVGVVFTDANGYYSFGEHQSGHDYEVFVGETAGYVYSPRVIYIFDMRTDQEANFLRQPFSQYSTISGKVTDTQGRPLSRVALRLSGGVNAITATLDDGTYSFFNIPAGISYTLEPSRSTYYFIPQALKINSLSAGGLVANFKWTRTALKFSAQTYSAKENAGSAVITVFRLGITTGTTTVNYAATNGTATAGSDYTAASGTLTFAPGETSQTFTIPISEDSLDEANESIKLTLSGVTGGAAIINVNPATLTIMDNDPVVASAGQAEEQSPVSAVAEFAGLGAFVLRSGR